jgi:aminoglycoside phosphotransferase (APT) family kinase protein
MDDHVGTRPVADAQAIDVRALQDFLASHLPDIAGPIEVAQFKGGQSNPTFKLSTPGRAYVMRTKPGPAAKLLPSAHAIEREFAVIRALRASAVPVPAAHLLCEDESVIGRAFYVMDFVDGRVLWDQALPGMDRPTRAAIYDELNRVIAALHNVDAAAVGLDGFGRPGNYFARQIARWTKQVQASATQPIAAMDRLIEWLPQHIPTSADDDRQAAIVHGDFRLDNLIFHPHEPRVLAVLDWELSTLGHPLADLSYQCLSWHFPPDQGRGLVGLDLQALGIPSERDYVRRYLERTGERTGRADADAVMADWNFYLAYNMFRLAGIAQGIAKRLESGTAASAHAARAAASARPLAEQAWSIAQAA